MFANVVDDAFSRFEDVELIENPYKRERSVILRVHPSPFALDPSNGVVDPLLKDGRQEPTFGSFGLEQSKYEIGFGRMNIRLYVWAWLGRALDSELVFLKGVATVMTPKVPILELVLFAKD